MKREPETFEFTVKKDLDLDAWYILPEKHVVKPLDRIVISVVDAPGDWWVAFDPGEEPRQPVGESDHIAFQIRDHPPHRHEDQTVLTYKFTIWVDDQYIDPEIIIDPPW